MATERQKKAIVALVENGGIVSKAMRTAGYTKATAKTPQKLTESEGFKELADPIIKRLVAARDRALRRLEETEGDARYRDLTDGIDKLTKNIQLLSGGVTDNVRVIAISNEIADKNAINTEPSTDS